MEHNMKVDTSRAKSTVKAPSYGQTGQLSQANSGITTSMVMEFTSGTMVGSIQEPGKITRCMAKEFSHG